MIRVDFMDEQTCRSAVGTVRNRTPLFATCRLLIEAGHDPDAVVQAYTANGTPSLRGTLRTMAKLTVSEGDASRPRIAPWVENPRHAREVA